MAGTSSIKGLIEEERPPIQEPRIIAALRTLDVGLGKIEDIALTAVLIGLIGVAFYQLIKVHVLPPAPFWTREIIKYCVLFIGMIAGARATQSDRLFNIDMFSRLFKQRGKLIIRAVSALFCIFICIMFVRGSFALREILVGEPGEVILPTVGILSLPIGAGLIGLHLLLHTLIDFYYLTSGKSSPDVAEMAHKL